MSSSSANADGSDHRRPGSSSGGPCGACKFLRRKCVEGCIYAPYFSTEQGATHFSAVHKVFGSSNVSKLLLQIPPQKRLDAAVTICYEAHARLRDPVYGCVASILALQQRVVNLQAEVSFLQAHLATLEHPSPPPFPPPSYVPMNTDFSIPELSSLSNVPSNVDLSSLFDPSMQLAFQQQHQHQQQLHQLPYGQMGEGSSGIDGANSNSGDLEALARELLDRQWTRSTTQKSSHTQF